MEAKEVIENYTPKNGEKVMIKVFSNWSVGTYIGLDDDGETHVVRLHRDVGNEIMLSKTIKPYTPPTPQKEWKTFLIEFSGIKYRAILQYETLEQAQFHHPNAISITEVKINIEEVL